MDKDTMLKKWLANDLTDAELADFKKTKGYANNEKIINSAKNFEASKFSTVNTYDDFKTELDNKKTPVIKFSSYKMLFRIAGLFIIGIGIYFLFFFNNLTTVNAKAGQRITFELPDASTVILNADSRVKYHKKEWVEKRQVALMGEAYFKVAKGSKFDVITAKGTVSVLGTRFTVKNRNNYFEVKCFEGIVSVNNKGKIQRLVQGATYRLLNGEVKLDTISNKKPQWINNKSSFKSVPLYEVLNELERQYNVSINSQEIDTKGLFTGGFVHNNIDQALKAVTVPFNLNYKKDHSNIIILNSSE